MTPFVFSQKCEQFPDCLYLILLSTSTRTGECWHSEEKSKQALYEIQKGYTVSQ